MTTKNFNMINQLMFGHMVEYYINYCMELICFQLIYRNIKKDNFIFFHKLKFLKN